jgi:putative aldouronate transport system permease protein
MVKLKHRKTGSKYFQVTRGEKVGDVINVLLLGFIAATMVYPVLNVLSLSFSSSETVNIPGFRLIPKEFSLKGYEVVLNSRYIWTGYFNTILRTVANTVLGLMATIGIAYPLSKKQLPHRRLLTVFIVIPMLIDGGIIPRYLNVRALGLLDTRWALILPWLVRPFYVIVMRNFFASISESLEESAQMEGASPLQILIKIIIPVSTPIIATVVLWNMVSNWNKWLDCLIYIQDTNKYVLQIVLRRILFESSTEMMETRNATDSIVAQNVIKNATIIVAIVPIICVYPFIQKYFVKGIMLGSVKG